MNEKKLNSILETFKPFSLEKPLKDFLLKKKPRLNKKTLQFSLAAIVSQDKSAALLKLLDGISFLTFIFPEIDKMKTSNKKYYFHPKGLFQHSFEVYEAAENILNNLKKYFPKNVKDIEECLRGGGFSQDGAGLVVLIKLAALFHDNAKPETAQKDGKKVRFIGHDKIGAEKIKKIVSKLGLEKEKVKILEKLIEQHMRPSSLTKNKNITKNAALRFFRDCGDLTPAQIILSMADWHSYKRLQIHSAKELKRQEASAAFLMENYFIVKNTKPLPKIIDGHIIMRKFNLKPGPWIGELLKIAAEKQKKGAISDTKDALSLISSKLTLIGKKYRILVGK